MNGIAGWILGILSDAIGGGEYKEKNKKANELESYILRYAESFDFNDLVEDFNGEKSLNEKAVDKYIHPVVEDYAEFEIHDGLANKLAWRDFDREHTKEEIEKMAKENGGYFGVALYDYEKKYWDEFEKNGYERLEIKE